MRSFVLVSVLFVVSLISGAWASEVKSVPTNNLPVEAFVTIALPEDYDVDTAKTYPTVYLLNGHGGDHTSWSKVTNLDSLATVHDIIIVCPAGLNSWYFDSPVNPKVKMESYISHDLVEWIDKNYRTKPSASQRAITGLSMGGHGAMWIALHHTDVFSNAGSTSGGVDFRPWPKNWNIPNSLGSYEENKSVWDSHTVISQVDNPSFGKLNIIIDCGEQDFFFEVNNNLHAELEKRGIKHLYLTSPGAHNGAYWAKSILPQLQFFSDCFKK